MGIEVQFNKQHESKTSTCEESVIPSLEEELPGVRISPSKMANLSSIFYQYNEAENTDTFFTEILERAPINREKTLENAKWAIYGTQLHYLQYFSNIFSITAKLGRFPNELDFRTIFPNRKDGYYEALIKILNKTSEKNILADPILNSIEFWKIWKLNGHNFFPKRHKNYVIDPNDIKELWRDQNSPSKEDIAIFRENYKERRILKDPKSTLLMSESLLILNIYFPELNCQIPTFIDEIQIPKNFPNEPIKIVDYKTGKQFKKPTDKEKIQIFLMITSVFIALIDEVKSGGIDFGFSEWDATHDINRISLPKFKERSMYTSKGLISSIYSTQLSTMHELMKKNIMFSYVNPLTQEELVVNPDDVFLGNRKEIDNIDNILTLINDLAIFYTKYRDKLEYRLNSKWAPYTLPTFPSEDFLKEREPRLEDGRQLSFNV